MADLGSGDGIDVLVDDHRRCVALFDSVADQTHPDPATVDDIVRELSVHDAIESEYLYPLVATRLAGGHDLARASIDAHVHIASLLAEIDRRKPDDAYRAELFEDLVTAVRAHVKEEESTLFVGLREHLAPEELARLGADLLEARLKAPTRPHPHAPRFSVGTRVSAATLRPVDRLRDALGRRRHN